MDETRYLSLFVRETAEHLAQMRRCLAELGERPDGLEALKGLFRSAHTLKGMAAAMGLADIARAAGDVERRLDQVCPQKVWNPRTGDGWMGLTTAELDRLTASLAALQRAWNQWVAGGAGEAVVCPATAVSTEGFEPEPGSVPNTPASSHGADATVAYSTVTSSAAVAQPTAAGLVASSAAAAVRPAGSSAGGVSSGSQVPPLWVRERSEPEDRRAV
ncbi:MAG: Hpt domain-containing protein, partial [Alicyclobacillus sp.]|nr:Hpt domain-containing protein [Alicyclobacillus sp.]